MIPPTTKSGTRLRCDGCNAEFIVVTAAEADLRCCNQPPSVIVPGRKTS
ncbi:hypothetical protein [Desertimonas flava]|nr:hypothetical protein [Desertimonas flava]